MEVLLALVAVLGIITLLGHGIWVVLAAIFRMLLGTSAPVQPEGSCPSCGRRTGLDRAHCRWCGRELTNRPPSELRDLAAFCRQLMRFEREGLLTTAEVGTLRAQAEAYRQRFVERAAEPTGKPVPEAPSPVELPVEPVIVDVIPEPESNAAAVEVTEVVEQELPVLPTPPQVERRPPSPAPTRPAVSEPARPPRKSWLDTLAGIMEEREIPWAEPIGLLVGGLLILGSSIALVISLWETLEQVPVFKFAVFMAVISTAFGIGLYIYHRWKLESTGRFVLMLATLLVPLGFLAMASLSKQAWTPLILAAELTSLGLSTWLVNMAARAVVPRWRWLNVLAVIGNTAIVLLVARLPDVGLDRLALTGVGLLPVTVFATVIGISLQRAFGKKRANVNAEHASRRIQSRAGSLLTLQGTAAFATIVSLGLLIAKGIQVYGAAVTLDYVAVPCTLLSMAVLASGLGIMRVAGDHSTLGMLRTVGTILAILGTLGMLVAFAMAWPQPLMLLVVGLLSTTILAWAALRHSFPIAHAGVMTSATVVYLTGFHLLAGHLPPLSPKNLGPEMLQWLTTGQSGMALLGLVVVFGLIAELFSRRQQHQHAIQYASGAGILALLSLQIMTSHVLRHPGDASQAAILYAFYGLGTLLMNGRYRRPSLTHLGFCLLATATGWALWWQAIPFGQSWANALLGLATGAVITSMLLDAYLARRPSPTTKELHRAFVRALNDDGLTLSVLSGLVMLYGPWPLSPLAISTFWLAVLWLVEAWIRRSATLFTGCQAMLAVATVLAISGWLERWGLRIDLSDLACLQIYGIGLAALSLLWVIARIATRPIARVQHLLNPAWPTLDQVVTHGIVVAQLFLVVGHFLPAIGEELGVGTAALPTNGPVAWWLFGSLALTVLVTLWDRWQKAELVSSLLLLATVPWLAAQPLAAETAVASALRWGLAFAFVVGVALVWQRDRLETWAMRLHTRLHWNRSSESGSSVASVARTVVVATTALPLLTLTLTAALLQLTGTHPAGPLQASWFFQIGPSVSYLVPLLLVIAGFVGLALRETSAGYAFSAGLVVKMTVVLGYVLALVTRGARIDTTETVTAIQLVAIAASLWALVWLVARRWVKVWREGPPPNVARRLMQTQIGLGVLGNTLLLMPALLEIVSVPWSRPEWSLAVGQTPGWIAVLLAGAAAGWYVLQISPGNLMHVIASLGLALGILVSCIGAESTIVWPSVRVLLISWASLDLLLLGIGYLGRDLRLTSPSDALRLPQENKTHAVFPPLHVQSWVSVVGLLTVGLALLHTFHYPEEPWWSAGTIIAVSVAVGLTAIWTRLPQYVWFSAVLVNLAGTVIWFAYGTRHWAGLIDANAIGLALSACTWSLVGRMYRPGSERDCSERDLEPAPSELADGMNAFPQLAMGLALLLGAAVAVAYVAWDLVGHIHPPIGQLDWTTLAAIAIASVILLWDRSLRNPLAQAYAVGLFGVVMATESWAVSPRALGWLGAINLAGFALLAALAGQILPSTKPWWQTLRIPTKNRGSAIEWFPQTQSLVAGLAAGLSAWVSLDPAFRALGQSLVGNAFPAIGPIATLFLVVAGVLMANGCIERWRIRWQQVTIGLGTLLIASIGWAWLDPTIAALWLHRTVIAMVATVVMLLVAGPGLTWLLPEQSGWAKQARNTLPTLAVATLGLLAAILGQECFWRAQGPGDFMALPAVVAVALALTAQAVVAIAFAVVPAWDPLHLSQRGRTAYVYATEVLLAIIGLHLWLARPQLFQLEILRTYWMLLVMGIAFAAALLSELFRRRGLPVLSEPLERTAVLLPLAPAIGFWLPIHPETTAMLAGNSPALWFLTGLFYGFLAISRRSFGYGLLAALATNLGLSVLWHRLDWALLEHPQIWFIPWGLTILVAEYLNHHRLTSAQSAGLRYLGLLLIYVSSSTEFLRTVGESLWLPMVLIALSVLGVALGIMLRIRSFLFLGITFLTLVLSTMIWHAAVQQQHMWIFWIFCIALGVAVLALVAFYEKRRNDVLAAVRKLKQWQR